MNCVFCEILYGAQSAQKVYDGIANLGIVPLNPVTPGHVILIPRKHVRDAVEDPAVTGSVMRDAALYVRDSQRIDPYHPDWFDNANIITSIGPLATQTVFHFHVHVIPRRPNDGLKLPWTEKEEKNG